MIVFLVPGAFLEKGVDYSVSNRIESDLRNGKKVSPAEEALALLVELTESLKNTSNLIFRKPSLLCNNP